MFWNIRFVPIFLCLFYCYIALCSSIATKNLSTACGNVPDSTLVVKMCTQCHLETIADNILFETTSTSNNTKQCVCEIKANEIRQSSFVTFALIGKRSGNNDIISKTFEVNGIHVLGHFDTFLTTTCSSKRPCQIVYKHQTSEESSVCMLIYILEPYSYSVFCQPYDEKRTVTRQQTHDVTIFKPDNSSNYMSSNVSDALQTVAFTNETPDEYSLTTPFKKSKHDLDNNTVPSEDGRQSEGSVTTMAVVSLIIATILMFVVVVLVATLFILKPKWRQQHNSRANMSHGTSECAVENDAKSRSGTYDEITVDASDENVPVRLNANSTNVHYRQLDYSFVEDRTYKEPDQVSHEQVYLTPLSVSALDDDIIL